jgi:protocatechuate 3,4-dioxygenase beta subunit
MREFLQLLATAVLVIASMAQTPATQSGQADKRQPDPCTISGRVVTAAEGTPIKSARVALVEQNAARHPHVFAASTDNDGRFEIKKVDPGRYEFVASHTAYISQRYQARGTNDGAILALVPGQEVNAVLFRLVRGGAITGRVIDEAGEPMVNVTVSVLQRPSGEEIEEAGPRSKKRELLESSSAFTDDRGEYRVFGLKPGDYYIKAAETDSPRGSVIWDGMESKWIRRKRSA